MNISTRQQKIIYLLYNNNRALTGAALAALLQVSDRTIRSDVQDINIAFKAKVILSSQKGYKLDRKLLFTQKQFLNVQNMISDEDFLIKTLLLDHSSLDFYEFCDERYLSTSSGNQTIKNAEKKLKYFHLSLCRQNNLLFIKGDIKNKHLLLNSMIQKDINPSFKELKNCNSYFDVIDIEFIRDITMKSIQELDYHIEETHATSLIINIGIAFSRMVKDYNIDIPLNESMKRHVKEYQIAKRICHKFEKKYLIELSKNDINYIHFLVLGFIKPNILNDEYFQYNNNDEMIRIIHRILLETEDHYQIDLNIESFLMTFVLHVQALILRKNNNHRILNPIKETLKKNSFFVFDISVFIANKLSKHFNITIDDDEIAFIAVHIGFQVEKEYTEEEKINVLIVADNYSEIKTKIMSEIRSEFNESIDLFSESDCLENICFDLIITTKLSPQFYGKSIINISPFYTKRDRFNVQSQILNLFKAYKQDLYKELMMAYFDESFFYRNIDFDSEKDAILFLSNDLEKNKIVNESFSKSVLKREELSSTAFNNLFAIPHAMNMDASKTMFSVLINDKPIPWGENDEVYAIILVAINKKNRSLFQDIYNGLIDVFGNPNNYKDLTSTKSFNDFIEYLTNYFLG